MIEAEELSVRAGRRVILDHVSLAIEPGRLMVIVGPNGAGKSTLLKAVVGEIAVHSGLVRIDGRRLRQVPAAELAARRAVLPQASGLAFPFTVHEVVGLGASPQLRPEERRARVRAALQKVDLAGFGARLYQELSGGEQQRVHLARVLCQVWEPVKDGVPRYLFLDEPTASLDLKHQLMTLDIARRFAEAGGGVVAILHDLNLAALYGDRIVAVADGRIVVSGPPASVVTDAFVADVFGVGLKVGMTGKGVPFVMPELALPERPAAF